MPPFKTIAILRPSPKNGQCVNLTCTTFTATLPKLPKALQSRSSLSFTACDLVISGARIVNMVHRRLLVCICGESLLHVGLSGNPCKVVFGFSIMFGDNKLMCVVIDMQVFRIDRYRISEDGPDLLQWDTLCLWKEEIAVENTYE